MPGTQGEIHARTTAPQHERPQHEHDETHDHDEAHDESHDEGRAVPPEGRTGQVPTAGPGERVWVLAVPFRAPAPGAVWHAGLQAHISVGPELPPELAPYDPPPYTLERFLEDEVNEKPRPSRRPTDDPARPAVRRCGAIAAHAAAGGRVFLLGDDPGVGKTGTASWP